MVTPAAKREAVAHLRSAFEMSERRACRIIGCVRMMVRYRSRRVDDSSLRTRLRALARERRRFGYRRLHLFLQWEGFQVNHKRLFRIYKEERLMVRRRGGRKRALGTRAPIVVPEMANDRWSIDFAADQLIDGRRLRILVVLDDCTRECPGLVADTSISGVRVARELDQIITHRGRPKTIVSDNGTEFTSNAVLRWADDRKVNWHYSQESRCRTLLPSHSSAACAMSCSMRACSAHLRTRGRYSRLGGRITTTTARIRSSAG
jgi:putative transposase